METSSILQLAYANFMQMREVNAEDVWPCKQAFHPLHGLFIPSNIQSPTGTAAAQRQQSLYICQLLHQCVSKCNGMPPILQSPTLPSTKAGQEGR
jgi:hypothetical protein